MDALCAISFHPMLSRTTLWCLSMCGKISLPLGGRAAQLDKYLKEREQMVLARVPESDKAKVEKKRKLEELNQAEEEAKRKRLAAEKASASTSSPPVVIDQSTVAMLAQMVKASLTEDELVGLLRQKKAESVNGRSNQGWQFSDLWRKARCPGCIWRGG